MYSTTLKFLKRFDIFAITIALVAGLLRFVNLGYSDFQGDEIKALFLPEPGQSIFNFLLDQRKGPFQFFVTYVIKIFDPNYLHHFFLRLPFALAGFFAVIVFYRFLLLFFSKKIAFYASFFFATNGFFIALSRIVQYQSFVMLFMTLALYMFALALKDSKWEVKGIYLGFIFWALSVLSHYDGVFIAPFVLYILFSWFIKNVFSAKVKHLYFSIIIFVSMLLIFYVPFVSSVSEATKVYWLNRVSGGQGKISSSRHLFQVYNPIYVIHIYTALSALGSLFVILFCLQKIKFFNNVFSKLGIYGEPFFSSLRFENAYIFIFLWFLFPFIFMEALINLPGTHIFVYLLPLAVILAFGVVFIENLLLLITGWQKHLRVITGFLSFIGIFIIFAFIFLQSYAVFVDNSREYPWEDEAFLFWKFHKPSAYYHLSLFGFPYYRNWDGISKFIEETSTSKYPTSFYSTNERDSISRYYIPFTKSSQDAGFFVYIYNPQSFVDVITTSKAFYWDNKYQPNAVVIKSCKGINLYETADLANVDFSRCKTPNQRLVKIYYTPAGSLELLRNQGY